MCRFFDGQMRVLRISNQGTRTGGFDGRPIACQNVFVACCEPRNVFFEHTAGIFQ